MSILTTFEILELYKKTILNFLDDLIQILPEEADLIMLRILFENQIPVDESMKKFSKRLFTKIKVKEISSKRLFGKTKTENEMEISPADMIREKNDKFFLENSDIIFGEEKNDDKDKETRRKEKITRWKNIWESKSLGNDNKESIWKWTSVLLKLAEMYVKNEAYQLQFI